MTRQRPSPPARVGSQRLLGHLRRAGVRRWHRATRDLYRLAMEGLLPAGAGVWLKRRLVEQRRRMRRLDRGSTALIDVPGADAPTLVLALGVDEGGLAGVAGVAVALREQGAAPLVVTDSDDFPSLRAHDLVFEYLPPAQPLGSGWVDPVAAGRLEVIRAAYGPRGVVQGQPDAEVPSPLADLPVTRPDAHRNTSSSG